MAGRAQATDFLALKTRTLIVIHRSGALDGELNQVTLVSVLFLFSQLLFIFYQLARLFLNFVLLEASRVVC